MKLQFLSPDDAAWAAALHGVDHDFYHVPQYCQLSSEYDGGTAEAALVFDGENFVLVPYVVRSLAGLTWLAGDGKHLKDITSPYGYPCPLVRGSADFVRSALAAWFDAMRQREVVSGFVRLHPLLDSRREVLAELGDLVERGRTVSIDLKLSLDELWHQTRENHRRDIVKKRRTGMTAAMEDTAESYEVFAQMYHETMRRVGASTYYYFENSYFDRLKEALGGKLSLCMVRSAEGNPLGGGLFTEYSGIVQYHLGGTYNAALDVRPSKLMFDFVRTWAKERGNRTLHLGGGFGAKEDSVFAFKAGFSPLRHAFHTWHVRFDPTSYVRLADERLRKVSGEPSPDFFPVYRA